VRVLVLFTVAGCSAAPVAGEHTSAPPPVALPAPDAAAALPYVAGVRGDACGECAQGLACLALPGGYCGSTCDTCDGACTETNGGAVCLKPCASDGDCRAAEGYRCDPTWHACAIPNATAIVPKQCARAGAERDVAFASVDAWDFGRQPSAIVQPPQPVVLGVRGIGIGGATQIRDNKPTTWDGLAWLYETAQGVDSVASTSEEVARGGRAPRLALARGGLVAVWRSGDGLAVATSRDALVWSQPVALDEHADAPLVAVGPDPQKHAPELVYVLAGARGLGMRVRVSRDGGATFDAAATTAMTGTYGNAVAGGDGKLHVVAIDGDRLGGWGSAMQTIQYTVSSDGGATFARPIVVSGRDELLPFYFANPSIAVDDKRKLVYVAYVRGGRDGVWDIVVAASKDGGAKWTRTTIGDRCSIHMLPNLAVDPTTGTLHVAYYDTAGAPGRFVHATCASGAAACTTWGAINTSPFEPLSTMPSGPTWLGDHASLVVDDKRRVVHAVWAQPVREDNRAVTRIFHAAAKLRR
jgi:hypothetical protein